MQELFYLYFIKVVMLRFLKTEQALLRLQYIIQSSWQRKEQKLKTFQAAKITKPQLFT